MSIRIASCHIYPLKSGRAIDLPSLDITPRGPRHDRLWMAVKDDNGVPGRFLTQRDRNCEKLALISPAIGADGAISFSAPGMELLTPEALSEYAYDSKVFAHPCKVRDGGDAAAQWISAYLGQQARLVRLSDDHPRALEAGFGKPGDETSLADGYPLLVTSLLSLDALSAHFEPGVAIGMDRFRPNIVLDGNLPFEEDLIHVLQTGDVTLEIVKPCARCVMPTIDQNSLEKGAEPMATLVKMRRGKGEGLQGVFFGQNAVPRALGTIHVGDRVDIIATRPLHPALQNVALKPIF